MDFRQKITLHFLIYITLCSVAFAQVVEIPDPNLRDAVREALNIAGRDVPLTQPLLRTRLTRLDAPGSRNSRPYRLGIRRKTHVAVHSWQPDNGFQPYRRPNQPGNPVYVVDANFRY